MQTETINMIEQVWAMADVAARHGRVSFESGAAGLTQKIEFCGVRFTLENQKLVRIQARGLDLQVSQIWQGSSHNVTPFPVARPALQFLKGNEEALTSWYNDIVSFGVVASPRKKVA